MAGITHGGRPPLLHVALATLTRSPGASVAIAASYTIAKFLLPGWLGAWRSESDRGVEMEVANSTEVLSRVSHGDAELGFVETTGGVGELDTSEVGRDELVAIVAPTHRLATRDRPLNPAQLSAIDLVCRESGSGTREALADALGAVGAEPPRPSLDLGSTSAVRGAVMGGAGLAVLSRLTVAADLVSGALVEVPIVGLDLRRPLRAVWRQAGLSPAGRPSSRWPPGRRDRSAAPTRKRHLGGQRPDAIGH